jgi:hypothetical protein
MKSFRDVLNSRTRTGKGRFVLASDILFVLPVEWVVEVGEEEE